MANKKKGNAADCITPNYEEPTTPEAIKHYRKSYKQQPGVTILHPGQYTAPKPAVNQFGLQSAPSERVADLMKPQLEGVQVLINEVKEDRYAGRKREPLGQAPTRNYQWPASVQQESFQFGAKVKPDEFSGKEVVFPPDAQAEGLEAQQLYRKTHGNFQPGEQKSRQYNWTNVNPEQHRFGRIEQRPNNQMQQIIQQEPRDSNQFVPTTIIKKNQEDFKNYRDDPIGQSRNQAQVNQYVTSNTAYGGQRRKEEWGVGQCLRGEPTRSEVNPDEDLGRTNKPGWRNQPASGDAERVFGVPTIRNDVQKRGIKSVADHKNYGDEKPAVQLLFPEKFTDRGLGNDDFTKLRPKAEIRSIFESIGYQYGNGKFEGVYARARQIVTQKIDYRQERSDDRVSVKSFQAAVQEMHHLD